jgi:hypothetical protein
VWPLTLGTPTPPLRSSAEDASSDGRCACYVGRGSANDRTCKDGKGLQWCAGAINSAGNVWWLTRPSVERMIMPRQEAFARRSLMHDAQSAHRCKGEGAQKEMAEEIAPKQYPWPWWVYAKLKGFPTDPVPQLHVHQICHRAKR